MRDLPVVILFKYKLTRGLKQTRLIDVKIRKHEALCNFALFHVSNLMLSTFCKNK